MTSDDIIRMAREAHKDLVTVDYPGHVGQLDPWTLRLLERFAALVAAAEREACAIAGGAAAMAGLDHLQVAAAIRARGEV